MHERQDTTAGEASQPQSGTSRNTVLVVGGYGSVGGLICQTLAARGDLDLIVAGRNPSKAAAFARSVGGRGVCLDLDDQSTWEPACRGVDWVLMCMDQTDLSFVSFLFAQGIHYADITASDGFLRAVEGLAPRRSMALISVGLAPGLTNIMAAWGAARLDRIERIDIGLLFGLGDRHGEAAIGWLADRIFDRARDRRVVDMAFGFGAGRRRLYAVDFSDQHSLARTLPTDAAWTGVAFESRLATTALFGMGRAFAGSRLMRDVSAAVMKRLRFGSPLCNASVAVSGWSKGERVATSVHFSGAVEARVTAQLAALQFEQVLSGPLVAGVHHTHQLLDPAAVLEAVAARGIGKIAFGPVETHDTR